MLYASKKNFYKTNKKIVLSPSTGKSINWNIKIKM